MRETPLPRFTGGAAGLSDKLNTVSHAVTDIGRVLSRTLRPMDLSPRTGLHVRLGVIVNTGPNGEADYADNRYWVRFATPAATDEPTDTAQLNLVADERPNVGAYITATNLAEGIASHNLPVDEDMPVMLGFISDERGGSATRWYFDSLPASESGVYDADEIYIHLNGNTFEHVTPGADSFDYTGPLTLDGTANTNAAGLTLSWQTNTAEFEAALHFDGITAGGTNSVTIPQTIADQGDTDISSPSDGQLLKFDGTNWVNWTPDYADSSGSYTNQAEVDWQDVGGTGSAYLSNTDWRGRPFTVWIMYSTATNTASVQWTSAIGEYDYDAGLKFGEGPFYFGASYTNAADVELALDAGIGYAEAGVFLDKDNGKLKLTVSDYAGTVRTQILYGAKPLGKIITASTGSIG